MLGLEPRGGLEIWTALASGAVEVTAVEPNPLIRQASPIYNHAAVRVASESPRSFIRRTRVSYEVIAQPLVVPYRSVRSGAYSLSEDYTLTVEAFRDALGRLSPDGVFVVTRWLQMPPSESLRTFALDQMEEARRLDELIVELRDSLGTTVVVVTHDLASILAIGDNSVYLDADTHTMIATGNPAQALKSGDPRVRLFLNRGTPT